MDTSTSRAPVAVARVARALTCLVYQFLLVALVGLLFGFLPLLLGGRAALLLHALIEWLTDRIAEWVTLGLLVQAAPRKTANDEADMRP